MFATTTPAAVTYDCPDCNSETHFVHVDDNVHLVRIYHDDTCPTLARFEGEQA